jgi:hypothetical protein
MANSICHFVEKEMREGLGGKKDWTITKHMAGRITYDYEWDYEDLTLNGILLNCEVDWTGHMNGAREILPVENIPFADLARDVRIHPSYSSGDGFMLTRCVQYAAAHLEKNFFFPRDFTYLAQNLDDDRELTTEHLDAASITRWKNKQTWGWDKNSEIETFEEEEDSDDEAAEVDIGVQKDEHKEFADVHDPLGLLNNLIAGQENTSSTSFHPHVTGSYHSLAFPVQSIAIGDMYTAGHNNVDLFPGHTQDDVGFASAQYSDALHHNISQVLQPVHGNFHLGASSSRLDPPTLALLYPPPSHPQTHQDSFYSLTDHTHLHPAPGYNQLPFQPNYTQPPPQLHYNPFGPQLYYDLLEPQPSYNELAPQLGYNQPPQPGYNQLLLQPGHTRSTP